MINDASHDNACLKTLPVIVQVVACMSVCKYAMHGHEWNPCIYINIYIYYPLYTNWPVTNVDLPHVIPIYPIFH